MASTIKIDNMIKRRWLPRFSLLSLLLFVCLVGSGVGLWWRWKPWVLAVPLRYNPVKSFVSTSFSPAGEELLWISRTPTEGMFTKAGVPTYPFGIKGKGAHLQLRLLNSKTGQEKWSYSCKEPAGAESIIWTNDGRWIFQIHQVPHGIDWIQTVWEARTGSVVYQAAPNFEENEFFLRKISHHGGWAANVKSDQARLVVRNLFTGRVLELENPPTFPEGVAFSPNGNWLAVVCNESANNLRSEVRIWRLPGGTLEHTIHGKEASYLWNPKFASNERLLALEINEGRKNHTAIHDLKTGRRICLLNGKPQYFLGKDKYFLTVTGVNEVRESKSILLWELKGSNEKATFEAPGSISYARMSGDGSHLYTIHSSGIVSRNLAGGKRVFSISNPYYAKGIPFDGRMPGVHWTQDSMRTVISDSELPKLYDMRDGTRLSFVDDQAGPCFCDALSPDGNFAVILGNRQYVGIYHCRRPEYWWGIVWLWEFWVTSIFGIAFIWSLRRDWNRFYRLLSGRVNENL